jgi:hypothetical protein
MNYTSMELKNVNSNGDNVVASNLNNFNILFFENYKNQVQIQTSCVFLFPKDVIFTQKQNSSYFFASLFNVE